VLAPRNLPHVWAISANGRVGSCSRSRTRANAKDFFAQTSRPDAVVGDQRVFEAHGMKVVGPPLPI